MSGGVRFLHKSTKKKKSHGCIGTQFWHWSVWKAHQLVSQGKATSITTSSYFKGRGGNFISLSNLKWSSFSKPISCERMGLFLHCECQFEMKFLIGCVIFFLFSFYRTTVRWSQPVLRPGLTNVFWLMEHPAPASSTVYFFFLHCVNVPCELTDLVIDGQSHSEHYLISGLYTFF